MNLGKWMFSTCFFFFRLLDFRETVCEIQMIFTKKKVHRYLVNPLKFNYVVNEIVCECDRVTITTSHNLYFMVVTSLTYSSRPDLTLILTVRQQGNHIGKKTTVNK